MDSMTATALSNMFSLAAAAANDQQQQNGGGGGGGNGTGFDLAALLKSAAVAASMASASQGSGTSSVSKSSMMNDDASSTTLPPSSVSTSAPVPTSLSTTAVISSSTATSPHSVDSSATTTTGGTTSPPTSSSSTTGRAARRRENRNNENAASAASANLNLHFMLPPHAAAIPQALLNEQHPFQPITPTYAPSGHGRHILVYDSRSYPGRRREFAYKTRFTNQSGLTTVYFRCMACRALRHRLQRQWPKDKLPAVPCIAVKNELLINDPDFPEASDHFCSPLTIEQSNEKLRQTFERGNRRAKAREASAEEDAENNGGVTSSSSRPTQPKRRKTDGPSRNATSQAQQQQSIAGAKCEIIESVPLNMWTAFNQQSGDIPEMCSENPPLSMAPTVPSAFQLFNHDDDGEHLEMRRSSRSLSPSKRSIDVVGNADSDSEESSDEPMQSHVSAMPPELVEKDSPKRRLDALLRLNDFRQQDSEANTLKSALLSSSSESARKSQGGITTTTASAALQQLAALGAAATSSSEASNGPMGSGGLFGSLYGNNGVGNNNGRKMSAPSYFSPENNSLVNGGVGGGNSVLEKLIGGGQQQKTPQSKQINGVKPGTRSPDSVLNAIAARLSKSVAVTSPSSSELHKALASKPATSIAASLSQQSPHNNNNDNTSRRNNYGGPTTPQCRQQQQQQQFQQKGYINGQQDPSFASSSLIALMNAAASNMNGGGGNRGHQQQINNEFFATNNNYRKSSASIPRNGSTNGSGGGAPCLDQLLGELFQNFSGNNNGGTNHHNIQQQQQTTNIVGNGRSSTTTNNTPKTPRSNNMNGSRNNGSAMKGGMPAGHPFASSHNTDTSSSETAERKTTEAAICTAEVELFCALILAIGTGFISQQPTMATSRFSSSQMMASSQKQQNGGFGHEQNGGGGDGGGIVGRSLGLLGCSADTEPLRSGIEKRMTAFGMTIIDDNNQRALKAADFIVVLKRRLELVGYLKHSLKFGASIVIKASCLDEKVDLFCALWEALDSRRLANLALIVDMQDSVHQNNQLRTLIDHPRVFAIPFSGSISSSASPAAGNGNRLGLGGILVKEGGILIKEEPNPNSSVVKREPKASPPPPSGEMVDDAHQQQKAQQYAQSVATLTRVLLATMDRENNDDLEERRQKRRCFSLALPSAAALSNDLSKMLSATALATILTTNGICTAEIGLANAEELAMVYGMKMESRVSSGGNNEVGIFTAGGQLGVAGYVTPVGTMLSSVNGHQISVPVLLAPGSTLALSRRILLLEDISGDNDGKKLFSLEASLMEKIQSKIVVRSSLLDTASSSALPIILFNECPEAADDSEMEKAFLTVKC